ncbi:hypothetical protein E1301_Tti014379 [Triplophysa tibetana]|uniref:Transmembrane protein n=1 Tax=Triplophysa tibetana TaxID=1572043 RepID=A0A5A9P5D4_9TELE|nr:hypothetical protein E1301_Tti014379 [Triplophysa tibetana]
MSSKFNSVDNTPVVIQQNQEMLRDRTTQANRGPYNNAVLKGFLRVQPKSLGIVQIMIAVLISIFGIVFTASTVYTGFTVRSGVTYWGSLISLILGIIGILLVLSIFQLVISICISAFACKATCDICDFSLIDVSIHQYFLRMSSPGVSADKATLVIQINPQVVRASDGGQEKRGPYHNVVLKEFLKVKPKSLGTVQIMIVVMILLCGIVLSINDDYVGITVYSGLTYWGSFIFIISICISAFACKATCDTETSMVNVSYNQIVQIMDGVIIFLFGILLSIRFRYISLTLDSGITLWGPLIIRDWSDIAVLLVFTVLQCIITICILIVACTAAFDTSMVKVRLNQLIISTCISAFACKGTCETDSTVVNVSLNQIIENERCKMIYSSGTEGKACVDCFEMSDPGLRLPHTFYLKSDEQVFNNKV